MTKKDKIKKLAKVLGIIVVLGFATIGVICSGILMVSCANSRIEHEVIEKKQTITKNAVQRGSYYNVGIGDITSSQALDSILSWASNNAYYNGFVNCDSTWRYYNLLQDYPTPSGTDNMDNMFYISTLNSDTSYTPTPLFQSRRLGFYSTITNANGYRFWQYYLEFGNDGNNEVYWLCYYRFTNLVNQTTNSQTNNTLYNTIFFRRLTGVPNSDTILDMTDYAFYFYENSTTFEIFKGVIFNTSNDYQNGFTYGYNEGYQNGYDVGRNDLALNGANPFDLIASAFNSMAGILDMKILPYISLGTLVFIPVIIAIVIVVVKVVRG